MLLALGALMPGCAASADGASAQDGAWGYDLGTAGDFGQCAAVKVTPAMGVVPVTLTATANVANGATPTWSVSTPSGVFVPVQQQANGLVVSWDATEPGTYLFRVEFGGESLCPGQGSALVTAPTSIGQPYRIRLTPPASSGLPQQDKLITVYGNTSQTDAELVLEAGSAFGGVLKSAAGPIAGEVQLLPMSGPELDVAVGATGSFSLPIRLDGNYTVVLIPSDPLLAPRTIGPLLGAALSSAQMVVDSGAPVTGVVRDETAAPLPGARVALRAGALPSGLGTTAADGSFALRAEPGTYQLAAAADGWPEVSFDGVVIPAAGLSLGLDHKLARNAVALRVLRADGVTPVAGAKVTLRSAALANAAQIDVGGGPQGIAGVARLVRTSAANGTLGAATLPSASFDVLVDAPDVGGAMPEGTTGLHLVVSSAGAIDLLLAPHVSLTGHVRDGNGKAVVGARVRAVVSAGSAPVRSTITDAGGAYTLLLAAGVPVDLFVDAPPLAPLASARMHLGASDGSMGGALPAVADVVLPRGLQIAGTVRGPNTAPLGGVGVDVLCLGCSDPSPIAHGESDTTPSAIGAYQVSLPDPGLLQVDAGVD
jgi:hypothetical protein